MYRPSALLALCGLMIMILLLGCAEKAVVLDVEPVVSSTQVKLTVKEQPVAGITAAFYTINVTDANGVRCLAYNINSSCPLSDRVAGRCTIMHSNVTDFASPTSLESGGITTNIILSSLKSHTTVNTVSACRESLTAASTTPVFAFSQPGSVSKSETSQTITTAAREIVLLVDGLVAAHEYWFEVSPWFCSESSNITTADISGNTTNVGPITTLNQGPSGDHMPQTREIALGVSFTIFLLVGLFAALCTCFRSKSKTMRTNKEELSEWKTLQKLQEPRANRPMKLVSLENIISKKQRDNCLLLREEFEDIVQSHLDQATGKPQLRPHSTGRMEVNRCRNRYNDIVTYDHSRVKLTVDSEGSDYINANFIPGYTGEKEYIAAQGPLPFTITNFWRMVWEHNVHVIVMLTLPKEDCRVKCEQYWPAQFGEVSEYDQIKVTNTSMSTFKDYIITTFSIQNIKKEGREREVVHCHYLQWKDMTADVTPSSLLSFHQVVRQYLLSKNMPAAATTAPMLVHCSAGVGRTGAFLGLDYVYQIISDRSMNEELDIYGFVKRMREHRCNIVQSEEQYIFIHQCARILMSIRRKKEAEKGMHNRISYAPSTSSVYYEAKGGFVDLLIQNPSSEVMAELCDKQSDASAAAQDTTLKSSCLRLPNQGIKRDGHIAGAADADWNDQFFMSSACVLD